MKLPKPRDYGYRDGGGNWNLQYAYSEDQLKQAIRDALEVAAKVCDEEWKADVCAYEIRKLKESVK